MPHNHCHSRAGHVRSIWLTDILSVHPTRVIMSSTFRVIYRVHVVLILQTLIYALACLAWCASWSLTYTRQSETWSDRHLTWFGYETQFQAHDMHVQLYGFTQFDRQWHLQILSSVHVSLSLSDMYTDGAGKKKEPNFCSDGREKNGTQLYM